MNYNKLREIRTERGMSVSELSRRTGLSRVTLVKIEKQKGNPTYETMVSISRSLNMEPDSIFFNSSVNHEVQKGGVK